MEKICNSFIKICALSVSALMLCSCAVYVSASKPLPPITEEEFPIASEDVQSSEPDISGLTEIYPTLKDADVDYIRMKNVDAKGLRELDYSDCTIAVLDRWGVKVVGYLTSDAVTEFIGCLTNAEIDLDDCGKLPKKEGAAFTYQITLKTGEQIYIDTAEADEDETETGSDFILINGKSAYGCDRESREQIGSYYRIMTEGLYSGK